MCRRGCAWRHSLLLPCPACRLTSGALAARYAHREHPAVVEAIRLFWSCLRPKDDKGCVDEQAYTEMSVKLQQALISEVCSLPLLPRTRPDPPAPLRPAPLRLAPLRPAAILREERPTLPLHMWCRLACRRSSI